MIGKHTRHKNGYFTISLVDEFDNPIEKTPQSHPYSYDGFVTYRNGQNKDASGTIYSDRLLQWDYERTRLLMKKHFGNTGDYYDNRSPEQIESFLKEWTGEKNLKLILVMQYCNKSSGYPLWRFDYKR